MDTSVSLFDSIIWLLEPWAIAVVLPISIVLIVSLTNKAKYNRRYNFLEKCIDQGVELRPELLQMIEKSILRSRVSLKKELLFRLVLGIMVLFITAIFFTVDYVDAVDLADRLGHGGILRFFNWKAYVVAFAIGIGLIVWYVLGKRMLEEDIVEEGGKRNGSEQ